MASLSALPYNCFCPLLRQSAVIEISCGRGSLKSGCTNYEKTIVVFHCSSHPKSVRFCRTEVATSKQLRHFSCSLLDLVNQIEHFQRKCPQMCIFHLLGFAVHRFLLLSFLSYCRKHGRVQAWPVHRGSSAGTHAVAAEENKGNYRMCVCVFHIKSKLSLIEGFYIASFTSFSCIFVNIIDITFTFYPTWQGYPNSLCIFFFILKHYTD